MASRMSAGTKARRLRDCSGKPAIARRPRHSALCWRRLQGAYLYRRRNRVRDTRQWLHHRYLVSIASTVFPSGTRARKTSVKRFLCHVPFGLYFLRVDGYLHAIGRQKVVARLGHCGREQRINLRDRRQDGTVRIPSSESLLHRFVFI